MVRLSLAGVISSFVLVLLAFYFVVRGFDANERADALVAHSYDVKDTISDISRYMERAEAARRGYLLDRNPARVETLKDSVAHLAPNIERLKSKTVDNPEQQARIEALHPVIQAQLDDMRQTILLAQRGDMEGAVALFRKQAELQRLGTIRRIAGEFENTENRLLASRGAMEQSALERLQTYLGLVVIALLFTGAATYMVLSRHSRELLASRMTLAGLNEGLEAAVAERTADLRRANEEIQRFAYIVSHDLRSPLVNVMGFTAELARADREISEFVDEVDSAQPGLVPDAVRAAAKEDMPEAIGFIRSSTQKMDRLINAILVLSRQGRRALAPEMLDMDGLLSTVVDTLSTLRDESNATIKIRTPLPALKHDRLAVDQIFSNLLENALKYRRPNVPGRIEVRGHAKGGRAIFEVEDNGRGIEEKDRERIFELFRRSGVQDKRGEGIGLANVRALAYRLGGTIEVRSVFGEGSTFVVNLPLEYVDDGKIGE
ncbi:CHASE3 domain-containing protein [Sphingobium sp. DEHP117]|uniref:sensor histidine kinase n=1 Tax=Sphingobium sp. DEHP117 TaxID=2993436 RepID=UPI0027D7291A|nr:CHASE3 domain-containing protein [Sphingobium sp. DEHP117]MDQ4421853.1 CHASE3 domain-containing protein [Sphingobium sp. DEHP117]